MSLECRAGCGACCISPSISSLGKPADTPCQHLTDDLRCAIFTDPRRPAVCAGLQPSMEMCGDNREYAIRWLSELEWHTAPARKTNIS
jgi:hypothetical protein